MKKLLLIFSLMLSAGFAGAQCTAAFSAAQAPTGNNLLNVNFTNTSTYVLAYPGQKKSLNIDYGDGVMLNGIPGTTIPAHVYGTPGTYTVGLRIRDYDSASNSTLCTDTFGIIITVSYPACGATIAVTGTGASRTFTATNPAATSGIAYSWNFGDATSATGSPVSHTYAANGTYNVTLTATAGSGPTACTYVNTLAVVVYTPPPALNCSSLHASFVSSVSSAVASFSNTSTIASSLYQTIANWNYGDGTTGAGYNTPPHTYSVPGVYPVKLVMTWKDSTNTTSCRDSVTNYVTITTVPTPANIISGNISYDTTGIGLKFFNVYLIKLDTATNILSAVDSTFTGTTASPYYAFGYKPAGKYRVKAAEWTSTGMGNGFIPTYHDSSVYWSTATVINHTGASSLNKNIRMKKGAPTTGTGFIGGNIALGANKGAAAGVSNMLVYLRDASMRVIQTTLTDASGNYSFPNIAFGPYSVWPERINYNTTPKTPLVLNSTYPSRSDIDFNLDEGKRNIVPRGYLSVGTIGGQEGFIHVTPVPASGAVTIIWNGMADGQFIITNITGKVVARTAAVQGKTGSVNVSLDGLSHGVYFVHGSGALSGKVTKLVVE